MKSIEDVLGKDYVQKALNNGVPTTLLEGEALHKVGISPDVLNEDQKFALQKYKQAAEGKLQSSSKEALEPTKDWKSEARSFLNDNSIGRGLGSLVSRYTLTANALTGNNLLNEQERNNILKYQEMVEKKKEEKNNSFLTPARKKAIEDLKLRSQNAQGFGENLKAGVLNVFDTLVHPREWTTEGIIDNIADPINLVGFGVGNITSKAVSRIAPKIANSLAAKMAIGGVAGSVEGGGVNALQSLGEELGKGKTLTQAAKSATQALSAGALAGGVLGSAGGGVTHIGVSKDSGDFVPTVGFKRENKPKYSELSEAEKENIKNEILNNKLLKNEADPIVSTKIKDNIDKLHQGSIQSLKDSINDLAQAEAEAGQINQTAKELATKGINDLNVIEVSDRLKTYTQIINDGNSVLDPRLEGTGILHTLEDNITTPILSPEEFFHKLKQKGVTDELAKITTEGYVKKNPNILQDYIEDKLTQATEAKISDNIQDHIESIPTKDLGNVIKNSIVVDDRAGVNEPVVYKVIPAEELKPEFKSGEGTQHRFADNASMIAKIINDFNPDLHFGREGGFDGVPIIDYQGRIVTGNHRASAIRAMYSGNKATPYIDGLKKYYGDEAIEGIKDPVLVRELLTHNDDKIQRIAKVSNEGRENSIADSLITNGAKIEPFINKLPPIINNNFELANYLRIQGVNQEAAAQGLLSYINPKIAHYVDRYLKNKRNDPRIFGILIENAYLFWNAKTYAKAENMGGVDISNILHTAIERLSMQKEATAKKELERVLDHYNDTFGDIAGQRKIPEVSNLEDLKGDLLGILLYSLTGRKDGGKEAFRQRFERAIETAKNKAIGSLFDEEISPKQTQWDMLGYLYDTGKEEAANPEFSSNLLDSPYKDILRKLIDKERNNDTTIHMAGDLSDAEAISTFKSESEKMGGDNIPTTTGSVQSNHRQDSRSDLSQSQSPEAYVTGGLSEIPDKRGLASDTAFGSDISETPSLKRYMGDDTLFSRAGDDRALSGDKSLSVSSDGPFMHKKLEGTSTDRGEGVQRVLDERGDGGTRSRYRDDGGKSSRLPHNSHRSRSNSSDRARDQRREGKIWSEQTGGRGRSNGYALSKSVHLSVKDFGTNYPEYYHDGKGAIQKLLQKKHGQVQGAFYRSDIGDITLVWGKEGTGKSDGFGLAKIAKFHPEALDKLDEIVSKGAFLYDEKQRPSIVLDDYIVGIRNDWKGDKTPYWVISSYKKDSIKGIDSNGAIAVKENYSLNNPFANPTTEKLKDQEISNEIKKEALEIANNANPTQDTQPYRPLVESVEKRVLQNKAEAKKEIIFNDLEDIKKDLPYLLKEQAEDVKFAEERFATGKRGVLFTNGTGTGKTFTGLGIAKRKLKAGAKNILILTQSTQKNLDWKKEGKILNIDMVEVKDTKDNPEGVIVATYSNFRSNEGLNSRTYDLIIYDESQSILGNKEGDITEIFTQHQNITLWNYLKPNTLKSDENFVRANELARNNQVVFLSATPFASHKALKYGEGLLFDRVDENFLMNNFGYTIRYGKLTRPKIGVDVGQLERDFADRMAKNGVARGRRLMSDYDYHRAFMKVDGGLGKQIDRALDILNESKYNNLYSHYRKKFNYHYVNKISESIKAKETLAFVKGNLDEGRKVVIFHSYNEGGVPHPFIENFDLKEQATLYDQYQNFKKEYPQYFEEMNFENPLDLYKKELDDRVVFYNGKVSNKNRSKALELFNNDRSGVDVLVVQIDAGGTGISLHDKTGIHPRVALKLNIPTKPITEIQSEGRIYRTGQKSDAAYVYAVTHLGIEQRVFANSINERIGTVENLALGSEARNLKDTFKQGYLEAKKLDSKTLKFTGGKDYDRAVEKLEPYAKAINDYFSRTNNEFDGINYFPTPEPIGYKMSKWADVLDGESVLEPSAGIGSIARYFSEGARATAIEPSGKLFSKLQVNISSENPRLFNKNFEDLNIREKFDGVVMNPPFENALEHLKKALGHLNSGGRVVALVPSDDLVLKHLKNLDEFTKDIKTDRGEGFKIVAEISLPSVAFERAGTNVNTKILLIDKTKNEVSSEIYDFSHIDKIEDLFLELGNIELPKRERVEKLSYDEPLGALLHNGIVKANEKKLSVSIPARDIQRARLNEICKVAKELKGMWVNGKFVFPEAESFKKFVESEEC